VSKDEANHSVINHRGNAANDMKTHTTAMDDSLSSSSSFSKDEKKFLIFSKKKEKDDDEYTFSAYTHSSPCHGRNDCITTTLNKPKHSTTYSVNIQVISTPQS
jgi:hypothetical protein